MLAKVIVGIIVKQVYSKFKYICKLFICGPIFKMETFSESWTID